MPRSHSTLVLGLVLAISFSLFSCASKPDPVELLRTELGTAREEIALLEKERARLEEELKTSLALEKQARERYELLLAGQELARTTDVDKHLALAERDQLSSNLETLAQEKSVSTLPPGPKATKPADVPVFNDIQIKPIPGTKLLAEQRQQEICIRPALSATKGPMAWLELRWYQGASRVLLVVRQADTALGSSLAYPEFWVDGKEGGQTDLMVAQSVESVRGSYHPGIYWLKELKDAEIQAIIMNGNHDSAVLRSNLEGLGALPLGKEWSAAMGETLMARVDLAKRP